MEGWKTGAEARSGTAVVIGGDGGMVEGGDLRGVIAALTE
jgi:hypothetical protein